MGAPLKQSSEREPAAGEWVAGSLAFAILAALPLFLNAGFLNTRGGGDSPFLLFRLHELTAALQDGVFPVRWMSNAAFGLGYPFFNYYASLPYYFAAAFRLFGLSFVLSLKLTQLAGFLTAGIGMFAWVRHITGRSSHALLASVAYTFAPFHIVNVYVRGDSLAEFWAMAWYPVILLAVYEAARQPSARRVGWVALSLGALVMTHNVSALIFSPFVAIYALGCVLCVSEAPGRSRFLRVRPLVLLAAAGILGLILAAWVWLPALAEQDFVQLGEQTTGYFFYGNHFRSADLIQLTPLFDYDTGRETSSPFSMGLVPAILTGAGAIALMARMIGEKAWWRDGFVLFGLAASTLMITPLSEPVWRHVPLLPFAQFPWRFLSVQALFSAAAISALVLPLPAARDELHTSLVSALTPGILILVAALGALNPNFIPLNDADVTPQRLQWYESFSGNIGTTIRYEYLPRWTVPRPYTSDILLEREPRAKFLTGEGEADRTDARAASQTWEVSVASRDAQIALPLLYFPGWQGMIDGRYAPITPVEGIGYAQITVPQGQHVIRLWLGRTPLRLWSEIASVLGLVALFVLFRPRWPRWDWVGWSLAVGVLTTLVTVSLMLHSLDEVEPLPGPLNADFSQEAYFHHSPGGILLADGTRITEKPSDAGFAPPPQQASQGARDLLMTTGLYFPWMRPVDSPALTSSGETRSEIYFAPVVAEPMPASLREPIADFGPVRLLSVVTDDQSTTLVAALTWQALQEMTRNYAVALRLYDLQGNEWAALDTQAGSAGIYPTGLWRPGKTVRDGYRLNLKPGIPTGSYSLRITMYDAASLEPRGSTEISGVVISTIQPCGDTSGQMLIPELGVQGIQLAGEAAQGDMLSIETGWLMTQTPRTEYQARWVLSSAQGSAAEWRLPLAPGSDPREWRLSDRCGYVLGRNTLDIPADLTPGAYALSVQLADESGTPVGEVHEAGQITITPSERSFDVPPLETPLGVAFGNELKLWGYSLHQSSGSLDLTVAWGALADPAADYKYFVHLYDPTTEQIAAQIDSMPRGYTYPTTQWVEGEVIAETLTLDLSGVPPGEYRVALGWYDPTTGTRLTPMLTSGELSPDGRVILADAVIVP